MRSGQVFRKELAEFFADSDSNIDAEKFKARRDIRRDSTERSPRSHHIRPPSRPVLPLTTHPRVPSQEGCNELGDRHLEKDIEYLARSGQRTLPVYTVRLA